MRSSMTVGDIASSGRDAAVDPGLSSTEQELLAGVTAVLLRLGSPVAGVTTASSRTEGAAQLPGPHAVFAPQFSGASYPPVAPVREVEREDSEAVRVPRLANPAMPATTDEVPPQAVRLHCQFTETGCMVWIGADGQALFDADAVAVEVQEFLARHGMRLLRLTCNGRIVTSAPGLESRQGLQAESAQAATGISNNRSTKESS